VITESKMKNLFEYTYYRIICFDLNILEYLSIGHGYVLDTNI